MGHRHNEKLCRWALPYLRCLGEILMNITGYIEGGLFTVKLKGPGKVAISTFFDPLVPLYHKPAWALWLTAEIK